MKLVGVGDQHKRDFMFFADGVIASATAPQLILPEHTSRSSLILQNTSANVMFFGIGSARATCTIASGAVNAVTVVNGGFGFTRPPIVQFLGGGIPPGGGNYTANTSYVGAGGPGFPSPQHPALAHCVLTGAVVTSIVIDDPGVGYVKAPYVFVSNDPLDPNGCFDPSKASGSSTGSGFELATNAILQFDKSVCPTDPVAVFCATVSSSFACGWTT